MGKKNRRNRYPNHSPKAKPKSRTVHYSEYTIREPFITRHWFAIVMILLTAAGIYKFSTTDPKPKAREEIRSAVAAISAEERNQLEWQFPAGYYLVKVSSKNIVSSVLETGEKEFHVNWAYARVKKFDGSQLEIRLPNVRFEPAGISTTLDIGFPRLLKKITPIQKFNDYELAVKILEDQGEFIVCAIGFRRIY